MAKQVQWRRGTTAEHGTFTGAEGEVTIDTDKEVVVVHDGTTTGGVAMAREDAQVAIATELVSVNTAAYASSGTIDKQDDSNVFETVVGNEYKMACTDRFANLDGNVLDTYGDELIANGDFSDGLNGWASGTFLDKVVVDGSLVVSSVSADNTLHSGFSSAAGKTIHIEVSVSNYISGKLTPQVLVGGWSVVGNITSNGKHSFDVTLRSGTASTLYLNCNMFHGSIDNISVKEITTVDMTNYIPEVQVQDQATNGLVVQSSVNAGDYVVVDKEELTKGLWVQTEDGWAIDNTNNTFSCDGLDFSEFLYHTGLLVAGTSYIISFDITSYTSGTLAISTATGVVDIPVVSEVKSFTFAHTQTNENPTLYFKSTNWVGTLSNISVKLKSDIYRATEDIPALTALTDSRFETRDYVSNQVLAYRKSDGTLGYETLFVDATETDTANDAMTKNGWSKVSNGWYSKGLIKATPLGMWQTLNKGAYHPCFNAFGVNIETNGASTAVPWYNATSLLNTSSTFNLIAPSGAGVGVYYLGGQVSAGTYWNGHPQGKFYDIIYKDQWIDLRIEANECLPQEELLSIGSKAKSGQVDGVSGLVGTVSVDNLQPSSLASSKDVFVDNISLYSVGDVVSIVQYGTTPQIRKDITITGIGAAYFNCGDMLPFNRVLGNSIAITKTLPILSSGSHLTTDLIGDPANYPQSMKDILASGKPLIGINPLLVGQDGTDYTDPSSISVVLADKLTEFQINVATFDSGATWTTAHGSLSVDSIANDITFGSGWGLSTVMYNYTAKNTTTKVSDPKAVKVVGNYATGTNSHSVYKGNQLVPTGKVNVGNGANGLESRGLENANIDTGLLTYYIGNTITMATGDVFYISDKTLLNGNPEGSYERIGGSATFTITSAHVISQDPNYWLCHKNYTSLNNSTPQHNTIALDNSNSPAVKFLETIAVDDDGMAHYQVFSQEMEYNATDTDYLDDIATFPNLTNGTADNLLGADRVRTIVSSIPLNKYMKRG